MLSRDRSLRPATWKLLGTPGNVFGTPRPLIDSSSTPCQGLLHSSNRSATGGNPVRDSTGKPVARSEERTRERRFQRRDLQRDHQPSILSFQQKVRTHRITWLINKEFRSRNFNLAFNVFMLEDKIQNPSKFLFRFSLGSNVVHQRSGDGRIGGRFKIIALSSGLNSFPES